MEEYSWWGVGQAIARCRRVGERAPGGSQRSVSTAVPATLLLARMTSAVAAGAGAGLSEPAPQPVTISAAAIPAMTATVRLASMSSKTAAPHRKVPAVLARLLADRGSVLQEPGSSPTTGHGFTSVPPLRAASCRSRHPP
jgi:hypothetical protein